MTSRKEVISFLESELELANFTDSSLNGLQIEGSAEVRQIGVAVDASLDLVRTACSCQADFLIVHHGLFWQEVRSITGSLKMIAEQCFAAGINLFAAHLPLDASQKYGNNFSLGRECDLESLIPAFEHRGKLIGCIGDNARKLSLNDLELKLQSVSEIAGRANTVALAEDTQIRNRILTLPFGPRIPNRVGVVSGAGVDALTACELYQMDTLITGEPRNWAYHYAKEHKLNVIFGGHYATEAIGVINLAKALQTKFNLPWKFIDIPTGI